MTPRARKWLTYYRDNMFLDPVEAAAKAGFKAPKRKAKLFCEKYSQIVEREKDRLWLGETLSAAQVKFVLSRIALGTLPATPQQVKALELLARIHGMLADKVDVNLEQSDLEKAMARAIEGFAGRQQSAQTQLPPTPLRLPELVDR